MFEYEKSIFDSDYNNPLTPSSSKIKVGSEGAADEMNTSPGTIRESSPEIFLQADRSCEGTDTDHYRESDADTSVEQPDITLTHACSSKYDLRHNPNPNPNCSDKYRF